MASRKTTTGKGKAPAAGKPAGSRQRPRRARAEVVAITPEERWRMIAVAAYHKAERRAFAPGGEIDDWLEAERETDALLGGR